MRATHSFIWRTRVVAIAGTGHGGGTWRPLKTVLGEAYGLDFGMEQLSLQEVGRE